MGNLPLFTGLNTCQVVRRISSINSIQQSQSPFASSPNVGKVGSRRTVMEPISNGTWLVRTKFLGQDFEVGGFNPSEKCPSNWKISPNRDQHKEIFETTT